MGSKSSKNKKYVDVINPNCSSGPNGSESRPNGSESPALSLNQLLDDQSMLDLDALIKNKINAYKEADANNDGIITKSEFKDWEKKYDTKIRDSVKRQRRRINRAKKHFEQTINKKQREITELTERLLANERTNNEMKKEITTLKTFNHKLHSDKSDLLRSINFDLSSDTDNLEADLDVKKRRGQISREKINDFVETLLSDENINIRWMPDYVERQLYRNIFTILIGLVENMLDNASIEIIGHKIKMSISQIE